MVAYNLMLAIFPFALLVLFLFGQVVDRLGHRAQRRAATSGASSPMSSRGRWRTRSTVRFQLDDDRDRRHRRRDLDRRVFWARWTRPSAGSTTSSAAAGCSRSAGRCVMLLGLVVLLLRQRHRCRPSRARSSRRADDLPFGLSEWGAIRTAIVVIGGLVVTFLIISAIYWAVPKGHMPWRSVWPGALFFALVTSAGNYIFPSTSTTSPTCTGSGERSASSSSPWSGSTRSAW